MKLLAKIKKTALIIWNWKELEDGNKIEPNWIADKSLNGHRWFYANSLFGECSLGTYISLLGLKMDEGTKELQSEYYLLSSLTLEIIYKILTGLRFL